MCPEATHITKVHDPQLSESAYHLAAYLVGDIELRQGHVRRAEQRILLRRHIGGLTDWQLSVVDGGLRLLGTEAPDKLCLRGR